ncbi:MAG: hypothetical protein JXD22_12570 [Sedimentisphaerales bacterium]|nr:hypothetical protein [Sedimentisphaerales bacterium]
MFEYLVFFLFFFATLVAVLVMVRYYRRRQTIAALALRLRMRFAARDHFKLPELLDGFHLVSFGHSCRAFNVMHGRYDDHELLVFTWCYETGSGQQRAVHHRNVVLWRMDEELPAMVALRDELFEPIGRYENFQPVNFDDPPFAHHYKLVTDQPETAISLLNGPLRKALLACPYVDWETNGRYLIFYTYRMVSSLQIARLISRSSKCCRILKESLEGKSKNY